MTEGTDFYDMCNNLCFSDVVGCLSRLVRSCGKTCRKLDSTLIQATCLEHVALFSHQCNNFVED